MAHHTVMVGVVVGGQGALCCNGHWFQFRSAVRVANVSVHHLWCNTEAVHVALTVDLSEYTLVVIVSQ